MVSECHFQPAWKKHSKLVVNNQPSVCFGNLHAAKERLERTLEKSPVPSWKTRASKGAFRVNSAHDGTASSNVLRRLNVPWFNLVAMIPGVPSDFPKITTREVAQHLPANEMLGFLHACPPALKTANNKDCRQPGFEERSLQASNVGLGLK